MTKADYRSLASFGEADPAADHRTSAVGRAGRCKRAAEEGERLPVWPAARPRSERSASDGAVPARCRLAAAGRHAGAGRGDGDGHPWIAAARLAGAGDRRNGYRSGRARGGGANVLHNRVSERVQIETATLADLIARREKRFGWVIADILRTSSWSCWSKDWGSCWSRGGRSSCRGSCGGRRRSSAALCRRAPGTAGAGAAGRWTCIIGRRPGDRRQWARPGSGPATLAR